MRQKILLCLSALLASLLLSSCASFDFLSGEIPSKEERCLYEGHPTAIPSSIEMKGNVKLESDGEMLTVSAVLCKLVSNNNETTFSGRFKDTGSEDRRVLVIWMNESLFIPSHTNILPFVVAREMGRYDEGRMCAFDKNMSEYLPCERSLDRFATKIIGVEASLKSLETIYVMMAVTRANPILLMNTERRIAMMYEYQEELTHGPQLSPGDELMQPDPQDDVAMR